MTRNVADELAYQHAALLMERKSLRSLAAQALVLGFIFGLCVGLWAAS